MPLADLSFGEWFMIWLFLCFAGLGMAMKKAVDVAGAPAVKSGAATVFKWLITNR